MPARALLPSTPIPGKRGRVRLALATRKKLAAYALAAVPLVGIAELALHVKQTSEVVGAGDWDAARALVKAEWKPDDLVIFAPFWADPLGREHFGDELAGISREARPDETRFARAFEVSIRGAHRDELAGWKRVSELTAGRVTIGVYENPAPVKVLLDLVSLVGTNRLTVTRTDGGTETPCAWQHGVGQPGGLSVPQGPAIPGDKYTCANGGYVGAAVLHALDHHPHLCLFATGASGFRAKFAGVTFGSSIHGHSGVQWLVDRSPTKDVVELTLWLGHAAPLSSRLSARVG